MVDPRQSPDVPEHVIREAEHWLVRLHSGAFTCAEQSALAQWQAVSGTHRQALDDAISRREIIRLAAVRVAAGDQDMVALENALKRRRMTRRALLGATAGIAAAAATAAIVSPPLQLWPSLDELAADYRTGTGEQRHVTLPRQVSLELNTRTSISIGTLSGSGEIKLIAGEIAVATAGTPLIVLAGNGRISTASGTLNLRQDDRRVTAVCLDGLAEVECRERAVKLGPGQRVAYDEQGLGDVSRVDGDAADAWRRGLLVFDNTPLSEVVGEINRYRSGRIVLLSSKLGHLPLDATFRLDRIEQAVPKIAEVFHLKVRSLPGGLVLLG